MPHRASTRLRDTDSVLLQAPFTMPQLRERLKAVGARWLPGDKLWRVRNGLIRGDRDLEECIVRELNRADVPYMSNTTEPLVLRIYGNILISNYVREREKKHRYHPSILPNCRNGWLQIAGVYRH